MSQPSATSSSLVHSVYFTLTDNSPAKVAELVSACNKYLKNHPGVLFFDVGGVVADLDREVNDQDFDVALCVAFKDRAAHDAYQIAADHKTFIEEQKESWKSVRVFDSQ